MSALKTEKYRYWLTYLIEDLPVGAKFSPEDIHLSVLNWFVVEPEVEKNIVSSFNDAFTGFPAFEVQVEDEVSLGPREDVSVFLVGETPQIINLHQKAVEWFEKIDARWAVKFPYANDEYIPHIRRRPGMQVKEGDRLYINSLTLVKALRRADERRWVESKVLFDG